MENLNRVRNRKWIKIYADLGVLIEGGIEDGITRHRQILDALKARDKQGARHAMAEHLRVSRLNVQLFDEMGTTSKKAQN
jgi:DNA-binding GntR family transcriptional regulator